MYGLMYGPMYGPMYGLLRSFSECGDPPHVVSPVAHVTRACLDRRLRYRPHPRLALTADREFGAQLLGLLNRFCRDADVVLDVMAQPPNLDLIRGRFAVPGAWRRVRAGGLEFVAVAHGFTSPRRAA